MQRVYLDYNASTPLAGAVVEAMRAASLRVTPHAMLSRAASGIRGCTLVVNLPGSPRGARENLEVILPALPHGPGKLRGDGREGRLPWPALLLSFDALRGVRTHSRLLLGR